MNDNANEMKKVSGKPPKLVLILGPHAVGKMTVGQELTKLTDYKLFHNHMSIELVRCLFPLSTDEGRYLNSLIREEVLKTAASSDNIKGLIYTYMFAFDVQSEYDYIAHVIEIFEDAGFGVCVAELCADYDVRIGRNITENRLANKASKRDVEKSEAEFRRTEAKYRLNSNETDILPWENYMKLDNTAMEPEAAARIIAERFGLL